MSSTNVRKQIRQQRRQLNSRAQNAAATSLALNIRKLPAFYHSKRMAFYLANDGEISPLQAMNTAMQAGKRCYLPVLHPLKLNRLYFVRHNASSPLRKNRFAIKEPRLNEAQITAPWALDIIFLPLVAFDREGHRLGMGGGFYDRTLAFTARQPGRKPLLVGLAHSFQELPHINASHWDIPLHSIVTEREIIVIKKETDHP